MLVHSARIEFFISYGMGEGAFVTGDVSVWREGQRVYALVREANPVMRSDLPEARFLGSRGLDETGSNAVRNLRKFIAPALTKRFASSCSFTIIEESLEGHPVAVCRDGTWSVDRLTSEEECVRQKIEKAKPAVWVVETLRA